MCVRFTFGVASVTARPAPVRGSKTCSNDRSSNDRIELFVRAGRRVGTWRTWLVGHHTQVCARAASGAGARSSTVVSRALHMGIPTVVNNVDWYAELPSVVPKLSVDHAQISGQYLRSLDELMPAQPRARHSP